jgi:2-polyprenyl-6-methoxyphenol hydroxylase-like FAD-dependent oxidoreductase
MSEIAETSRIGRTDRGQAIVIGAGMAGLTAARAVADHFDHVVVLERDDLSQEPAPRRGTPQSWHLHGLLGGGHVALDALFPGIGQNLVQAGAVPMRVNADLREEHAALGALPQRDFGWIAYSMSRALIELTVRQRLMQQTNVTMRPRTRALEIVAAPDGGRVVGVQCVNADGACETLSADLVIDASGHSAPTIHLLQSLDLHAPDETVIGIDLGYTSGIVAIPDNAPADWKGLMTLPNAPENSRRCVMLPIEGNRWMVTMVGRKAERPPGEWDAFLEFAQHLATPTAYRTIRNAKPLRKLMRFGFPESVRRHFERLDDLPDGLLPIGDAICRFNPVYGQGMTVAAQEAHLLHHLLRTRVGRPNPLVGLGRDFLRAIQPVIETPWMMAAIPDFIYPDTRGERPDDLAHHLRFMKALRRISIQDAAFHKLTVEVWHLIKPHSVYKEAEYAERIAAEMAYV